MGWTRKKIGGSDGTRRVAEGGLAGDGRRRSRNRGWTTGIRGRDGHQYLAFPPVCLWSRGGERAFASVAHATGERMSPCSGEHERGRDGAVPGGSRRTEHEGGLRGLLSRAGLAPSLKVGQVVVMDNLSSHKGSWVRELVEEGGSARSYTYRPTRPILTLSKKRFRQNKGADLRRAGARVPTRRS